MNRKSVTVVLKSGSKLVYRPTRGTFQQRSKSNFNCRVKYVAGGNSTVVQAHKSYKHCGGPYEHLLNDMERTASKSDPIAVNEQARIDEINKLADEQRKDAANKGGSKKRPEVVYKQRSDRKK